MHTTTTVATAHVNVPPLTARLATEAGQAAAMHARRRGLTTAQATLAYNVAYKAVVNERAGK